MTFKSKNIKKFKFILSKYLNFLIILKNINIQLLNLKSLLINNYASIIIENFHLVYQHVYDIQLSNIYNL